MQSLVCVLGQYSLYLLQEEYEAVRPHMEGDVGFLFCFLIWVSVYFTPQPPAGSGHESEQETASCVAGESLRLLRNSGGREET